MEQLIPHFLGLTELYLRHFGGMPPGFDLDRTLANLSLMPVFAKSIFHKPGDIVSCKSPDWISGGNSADPLSKITATEAVHFDANKIEELYDVLCLIGRAKAEGTQDLSLT